MVGLVNHHAERAELLLDLCWTGLRLVRIGLRQLALNGGKLVFERFRGVGDPPRIWCALRPRFPFLDLLTHARDLIERSMHRRKPVADCRFERELRLEIIYAHW